MSDENFVEKFTCANVEEADDLRDTIKAILAIEQETRDLKERKRALVEDLIDLDPTVRWEMGPEMTTCVRKKKKFTANVQKIADLFSLPEELVRLLISQPFKGGACKKYDAFTEGEEWTETEEDKFEFSKYNPQVVNEIVFQKNREQTDLAKRKEA